MSRSGRDAALLVLTWGWVGTGTCKAVCVLLLNAGPAEGPQVSGRYESIHLQLYAC